MQEQGHSALSSELSDRKLINMVLQGRIPLVTEVGSIPEQSGSPSRRRTGMGSKPATSSGLTGSEALLLIRTNDTAEANRVAQLQVRGPRNPPLGTLVLVQRQCAARGPTLLKNAAPSESQVRLRPRKHTARALPRKKKDSAERKKKRASGNRSTPRLGMTRARRQWPHRRRR